MASDFEIFEARDFVKSCVQFVNRCHKPNRRGMLIAFSL